MGHFKSATSLFSSFLILISISTGYATDEEACRGPIAYYEDLGCIPVYKFPDDPCPYKYNCDDLTEKSSYECYGKNKMYPSHEINLNCTPTYTYDQSPQTDCSTLQRCQNDLDKVIPKNPTAGSVKPDEMVCRFGTFVMRYGDELNVATSPSSACMHCVCEVGPVPTCQRFSPQRCVVKIVPRYRPIFPGMLNPRIPYYNSIQHYPGNDNIYRFLSYYRPFYTAESK